jgi:hypothetical protein
MPEDPEIDTDKLDETIHDRLEREGGQFLRRIALTTAILAAFAAVASLQAGATVNEALVLKTEATRLQAQASDQWAYYQAKGLKAAIQEASRTPWQASRQEAPAEFEQNAQHYTREQEDIKKHAEAMEQERDERSKDADHLLERHHGFANAVALFQIAIALGAVAALTRARTVWFVSVLVGLAAIVLFTFQFAR